MDYLGYIKKALNTLIGLFNPSKPLGGLEVSDTLLQYIELYGSRNGKAHEVSLRLPPGIIESGLVKDGVKLVDALRMLHKEILPSGSKPVDIILTIPANNVYVQTFSVPTIGGGDLSEAAELNLRMVSPIDVNTAYYGWQSTTDSLDMLTGQSELLAAFVDRKTVDDYVKAVQDAGYAVDAVESSTLSLSRSLYSNKLIKADIPYLVIQVQSSGIYFMIMRNRSIAFNFFSPWATVQGQSQAIELSGVKNLMEVEMRRLLNFYSSHWGGQISNVALMTPALQEELATDMRARFPSVTVDIIKEETVSPAYGAALRGMVPRSRDTDISLNNVTAHEIYRGQQILEYLSFWRSAIITIFATLLILFLGSDMYLRSVAASEAQSVGANLVQTEAAQLADLQSSATQFNNMISVISIAQKDQTRVSWLIGDINEAASADGISLSRVYLQTSSNSGLIVGNAKSQSIATDFRGKLSAIPQLGQAQVPFSTITVSANGSVNFTATFQVTSWSVPQSVSAPAPSNTVSSSSSTASGSAGTSNIGQQLINLTQTLPSSSSGVKPIIFTNLVITSASSPITVQVSAVDKTTADLLNSSLSKSPNFHNVQVSPESIGSNGRVNYSITFSYSP